MQHCSIALDKSDYRKLAFGRFAKRLGHIPHLALHRSGLDPNDNAYPSKKIPERAAIMGTSQAKLR
jgi:hypothetical protein